MTRDLISDRRGPPKGEASSAVIFVHGYGADGADLLGLSEPLAPHMPDTVFHAPNAPEPCGASPMGYQWFPIPWLDGSSPKDSAAGLRKAADDLNAFIDATLEDEGITPSKLAIVGFSQGTMLALEVLPRRAEPVAALVGFSGRLLRPEDLASDTVSRPPVLLIHGDQDDMVPPAALPEAAETLVGAGFQVMTHVSIGTGHGIAPDGLSLALAVLRAKLGIG